MDKNQWQINFQNWPCKIQFDWPLGQSNLLAYIVHWIGCFLRVITTEEVAMASDPLRKIRPLQEHIKKKCLQFYQPCQYLSIDERMVKSKARCHLVQYMKNKPCKWGFKYWVIADSSGYTVDFDLYAGKTVEKSLHGLAFDVVLCLCRPFTYQGYQLL